MGGVRRWVTGGGTLHPIKGSLLVALCKQRGFFWSVIYRRLLLLTSSLRPATAIGRGGRERRKRACIDRISPLVNSKVNTVERERRKSTSVTQTGGEMLADVRRCIKD